jgi:hypothetical protein
MGSTNRNQVLRALQIALLALTAVSVGRAQQQPAPTPAAGADSSAQAPVAVAPVVPPEAPVMPPKVVCKGDQMTISANNSTLSSVLDEVHRCMGTKIDLPDGAGQKRMFDRIGPGPASQVIDELLSNTGYNYVVGASPANQEKIESIMLLARNSTDAAAGLTSVTDSRNLSANRRAFLQMHQASIPHPMTDADAAAAAEAANPTPAPAPEPAPADTTATPAPASTDAQPAPATDPNQKPADTAPVVPDTPPATPPPNVTEINGKPATTQDQITNMQQMFELRKQMNQPPSNPPQ